MSVSFSSSRKKRTFWEDDNELPTLINKKTRHVPPQNGFHLQGCSENKVGLLLAVKDLFPMLDEKTIAAVLERYGDNVDAAIKKLEELQLDPQSQKDTGIDQNVGHDGQPGLAEHGNGSAAMEAPVERRLYVQWLDTVLQELCRSDNQMDTKRRLERALKAFEEAAIENYKETSEEMKAAKKQFETLRKNNAILCKALSQTQEHSKAQDQELARLQKVLVQAEERIKSLEVTNYSLTMHLERAIGPKVNDRGVPPDIF